MQYRWTHNRNQAIDGEENQNLFIQLPPSVQMRIFSDYLYHDFLLTFRTFFLALKKICIKSDQNELDPVTLNALYNSFARCSLMSTAAKPKKQTNKLVFDENFLMF